MEMGAPRLDVYRDIHKAVRAELFEGARRLGRADWRDQAEVEALQARVGRLIVELRDHVRHEEEHMHPLIERRVPGAVGVLRADHEQQEAFLDEFEAFAERVFAMEPGDPMRARAGLEVYRALSRFIAVYLPHLEHEETTITRALWELSTNEELAETYGRLVGTMPREELIGSLEIMLPAINPHERVELLGGIRAGMPDFYDEAAAVAQRVLSEDEWSALQGALAGG